MVPKHYDLSVIVVNWNGEDFLQDCLFALFRESSSLDLEIIVVDNASSDNSVMMVKKSFPTVKLIENSQNLGFSRANNQALEVAEAPYCLLLNSDVFVQKGVLEECLRVFKEKEKDGVGALGVRMVGPDGRSQQEDFYRKTPSWWQILFFYLSFDFVFLRIGWLRKLFWTSARDGSGPVDQIPGAFLLTSRRVIDLVGVLDERFFIFFEDADWGLRVRQQGLVNFFYAPVKVVHIGSASFAKAGSLISMRQFFRSLLLFWEKHHGFRARRMLQFLFLLDSLFLILIGLLLLPGACLVGKKESIVSRIVGRWQFIRQVLFSSQVKILPG